MEVRIHEERISGAWVKAVLQLDDQEGTTNLASKLVADRGITS